MRQVRLLILLLFVSACDKPAPGPVAVPQHLPDPVAAAFSGEEIELLWLFPQLRGYDPETWRERAYHRYEQLHGYPVLARRRLSGAMRDRVLHAVYRGIGEADGGFWPASIRAMRFVSATSPR